MADVHDNPDAHRYELTVDGRVGAFVTYVVRGDVAEFVHTETVEGFEGRGLAKELVRDALDDARRRGWQVRPSCPFVRGFIERNPEYADLVPA
jgi:uncharacterized protein